MNLDLEKKQYFILEKQNLRIYKKQSKSKINVWGLNGQMKLIKKNYLNKSLFTDVYLTFNTEWLL